MYFDKETGLLVRHVRDAESPVGRIPTQIDYADYREVAGVKMTSVQPNVGIDLAIFRKPAAPPP